MRRRTFRGRVLWFGLVTTLLLAGGCAQRQEAASPAAEPAQAASQPAVAAGGEAVHQGGFHLAVVTEKSEYRPGEVIVIQATLSNLSQQAKDYTIWGIGDPQVYVSAKGPSGEEVSLPANRRQGLPAKVFVTLQPGEGFTYSVKWDQTAGGRRVAPGKYTIKAYIYPGRLQDKAGVTPVEATRELRILP